MLYFWKVILKVTTFLPYFLTKLSQKHKKKFLNKMKLGTNPQKLFLHPKSNFTICEKKSTTIASIFKKLWLFFYFSNFSLFGSFALVLFPKDQTFLFLFLQLSPIKAYWQVLKLLEIYLLQWTGGQHPVYTIITLLCMFINCSPCLSVLFIIGIIP